MKQKQLCSECHKNFFTNVIKVWVFKKLHCPIDRVELNMSIDGNVFICPKCNKEYHRIIPSEFNSLGTTIEGSTRSSEERDKRKTEEPNTEFAKVLMPEDTMCQNCLNYQTRYAQANAKREKKIANDTPDRVQLIPNSISNADIYKHDIFEKVKADLQEIRKQEGMKQQQETQKQITEQRKAELALNPHKTFTGKDLLPTKEEMKPLVDPETMKIEQEAQKKDIHIAEMKKRAEEEKQLEKDLKKQDTKITRLKKKLEEAKKLEK